MPKFPHYFILRNWSQYSKACQVNSEIYTSILDAINDAENRIPFGPSAQIQEFYSEITEHDAEGEVINTHYFIR